MKRVEFNGLSMAYDDEGEGISMLCIHGYPLNRQIWQPQWEGLAKRARVVALDLRSHGDLFFREPETLPAPVHSMDILAEDLAHLLDFIDVRQPVIINGMSMGGYAAFAFYRRYPSRVRGLILTATRARPDFKRGEGKPPQSNPAGRNAGCETDCRRYAPAFGFSKNCFGKTGISRPHPGDHAEQHH